MPARPRRAQCGLAVGSISWRGAFLWWGTSPWPFSCPLFLQADLCVLSRTLLSAGGQSPLHRLSSLFRQVRSAFSRRDDHRSVACEPIWRLSPRITERKKGSYLSLDDPFFSRCGAALHFPAMPWALPSVACRASRRRDAGGAPGSQLPFVVMRFLFASGSRSCSPCLMASSGRIVTASSLARPPYQCRRGRGLGVLKPP